MDVWWSARGARTTERGQGGRTETSGRQADLEPMMTTVPERRSRMCGRTALVTFRTPKTLVWNWVSAARDLIGGNAGMSVICVLRAQ